MTVKEDLIKTRAKIAAGWCQGASARNAKGEAVSFCILGAFMASGVACSGPTSYALAKVATPGNLGVLARYNDTPGRTKEEVLAVFDKAIACAQ